MEVYTLELEELCEGRLIFSFVKDEKDKLYRAILTGERTRLKESNIEVEAIDDSIFHISKNGHLKNGYNVVCRREIHSIVREI